jgi:KUP system potassium uptake protein
MPQSLRAPAADRAATPPERPRDAGGPSRARASASLALAALGIVFGDIGTSPLYALKACFSPEYGLAPTPANVLGVLSLIVWALTLVVSVKYIAFIMRADNCGEGGILALLALVRGPPDVAKPDGTPGAAATPPPPGAGRRSATLVALGLFGAALLYGDGVITPAISVLSAVEGLEVATPVLARVVVPLAVILLVALFLVQRQGTGRVGRVFGPVMLLWFVIIGTLGVREIGARPGVLRALDPLHGARFLAAHGARGALVLGAVVLAVTGAEALYADMGHFGRRPIRLAWFALVFPMLLLNYFGQGALLLRDPAAAANPFYLLAPPAMLYPLVVLATVATVIASQALISGAFSLTQQAMQLGYAPRLRVLHTSARVAGQIYVPTVNGALMVGCVLLVLGFRSSDRLSAAYGIAVTGTMVITTVLFYVVARTRWGWPRLVAGAVVALFIAVDGAFLLTNLVKIAHGGWVPLAIAALVFTLLTTWERGRLELLARRRAAGRPFEAFVAELEASLVARVPGTAVFLTGQSKGAPPVLLRYIAHTRTLQDTAVLLSVLSTDRPAMADDERVTVDRLPLGFVRITARYGFMELPRIDEALLASHATGVVLDPRETSYVVARERVVPDGPARMARWRKQLFALVQRNAHSAPDFFALPPDRVVELGAQVPL